MENPFLPEASAFLSIYPVPLKTQLPTFVQAEGR
jgi:hypothetical protein